MNWPLALTYTLSAGLAVALAYVVWTRRGLPGALPFSLLLLAAAEWALTRGIEELTLGLPNKVFWEKFEYLGIASLPVLWLLFALQYAGLNRWLTSSRIALLSIIPGITVVMVATNELHGLHWSRITPLSGAPDATLVYSHGPWFWVAIGYTYVLMTVGAYVLVRYLLRQATLFRRQAVVLLVGIAIPWIGNVIYLANLSPWPGRDLTPFAFTLTGLIYVLGLFRYQLFDLAPIARDSLVEKMREGVLVVDMQNRIVDINAAAQRLIGPAAAAPIGQSVEVVLDGWPVLVERFRDVVEAQTEIHLEGAAAYDLDLRISPLRDTSGRLTGRLITWRDITLRKQVEEEHKRLREFHENIIQRLVEGIAIGDENGNFTFVNPAAAALLGYESPDELVGQHWTAIVPADQQTTVATANQLRAHGETDRYEVDVLRKDGTRRTVLVSGSPQFDSHTGQRSGTLAVFTDITELRRAREEMRQQTEHLSTLNRALQALTATLDLPQVLETILIQLQHVVPYDSASVMQLSGDVLEIVGGHGFPDPSEALGVTFRLTGSDNPNIEVVRTRAPFIVADAPASYTSFHDLGPATARIRAWMGVPMLYSDRLIGMLTLDKHEPEFYTQTHAELALAFAAQAAIAIENARLYEHSQRELAERKRAEASLRQANERLNAQLAEIEALHAQLREQAVRDPLTGLYNRRYLKETLERDVARATRAGDMIGLIMMDIDEFKKINDTFGHKAGDLMLQAIGHLLRTSIRHSDIVCRYGGEEFLVVMPGASLEVACQRAEKLREAVQALHVLYHESELLVTLSLGISAFPEHGRTDEELLRSADQALYRAKAEGRNRVVAWDAGPTQHTLPTSA